MIVRKQQYYDDFCCIADKCPESCCEGWQIVIDDDSLDKYEKINGAFGNRVYNSIDHEEGTFLQYMGRCAFLNDDNLCDLQCELGEEGLCQTCRQYPRHIEEFYGVREYSLSLSCPEAARIMLTDTSPMEIVEYEDETDEDEEDFEDFDFLLYDQLEAVREKLFCIAKDRKLSIDDRLNKLLALGASLQEYLDENKLFEMEEVFETDIHCEGVCAKQALRDIKLLYSLEFLHSDWKQTLDNAVSFLQSLPVEQEMQCPEDMQIPAEQILMFFLYTYFSGAVYDDMIYSKLALAVQSVKWIYTIYLAGEEKGIEEFIRAAYRYAREVEHSDINLNTLEEYWI